MPHKFALGTCNFQGILPGLTAISPGPSHLIPSGNQRLVGPRIFWLLFVGTVKKPTMCGAFGLANCCGSPPPCSTSFALPQIRPQEAGHWLLLQVFGLAKVAHREREREPSGAGRLKCEIFLKTNFAEPEPWQRQAEGRGEFSGLGARAPIKEIVFMNFIETSRKQRPPPPVEVQAKEIPWKVQWNTRMKFTNNCYTRKKIKKQSFSWKKNEIQEGNSQIIDTQWETIVKTFC